jgi:hypothetical protein
VWLTRALRNCSNAGHLAPGAKGGIAGRVVSGGGQDQGEARRPKQRLADGDCTVDHRKSRVGTRIPEPGRRSGMVMSRALRAADPPCSAASRCPSDPSNALCRSPTLRSRWEGIVNVWPAPSARAFSRASCAVYVNVSGLGALPRPRWRSARSGPHKLNGIKCHWTVQGSRTPVDCQAISLPPPADLVSRPRQTDACDRSRALRRHRRASLKVAPAAQHGIGHPCQLGRKRDDHGVLVRARQ